MVQPPSRHRPDPSPASRGIGPPTAKAPARAPIPDTTTLARNLPQVLGASLLLAGWAMAGAAQAQSFDSVVVFGDSVSDPGNAAYFQNLQLPANLRYPDGANFSTNPDWVWTQHIEEFYGDVGQYDPSGTNYAFGGARVTRDLTSLSDNDQFSSISGQMGRYFASLDGEGANPDALYVLWGGANDLNLLGSGGALERVGAALESLNNLPAAVARFSSDLAGLPQTARTAASNYLGQIRYLQEKGAKTIVILNLPPIGDTPGVVPLDRALADIADIPVKDLLNTNGSLEFNQTLADGLSGLGHGVVAVDVHGLFRELTRQPANYGFQSVTQGACTGTPIPDLPFNDACGPANSAYPYPFSYDPNTKDTYLFADNAHPSGAGHQMLANVVTSTLSAPVQVSLAGEGGLSVARMHRHAVARRGSSTIPLDGATLQFWAAGALAQEDQDALPTLGDSSADLNLVTLGVSRDWNAAGVGVGAAVSFGNHHNTAQGVTLDSAATLWSLDGQWERGPLQLKGGVTLGSTAVDIERSIVLGPAQRLEAGSTTVSQFGANLDLDYTLPNGGNHFRHGLSAGLGWINQDTDGYREGGSRSTAMNFAKFSRRSLTVRAGYGIEAAHTLGGIPLRPYARIGYERELETDPVRVSAGVNSMPGASFSLDGLQPPADAAVLAVGAVADVHEHMEAYLDYTFRTGDQSHQSHQVELGLGRRF